MYQKVFNESYLTGAWKVMKDQVYTEEYDKLNLNKPFALNKKGIYQLYLCDYEYGIVELKYSEGTL